MLLFFMYNSKSVITTMHPSSGNRSSSTGLLDTRLPLECLIYKHLKKKCSEFFVPSRLVIDTTFEVFRLYTRTSLAVFAKFYSPI